MLDIIIKIMIELKVSEPEFSVERKPDGSYVSKAKMFIKMEEKELNLVEKLKRVPEGTELYSTMYGVCAFKKVEADDKYPIKTNRCSFASDGKFSELTGGECTLFPSRTQRNWDLFHYALKGEYVTVLSLNSADIEIKYVCQVENDGVFDVENSVVLKSRGAISKRLVEVRESTQEEIGKFEPEFKLGDVVTVDYGNPNIYVGLVTVLSGGAPVCVRESLMGTMVQFNSVRKATPDEINEWKKSLRSEHNAMLKDGDIVPWRADKMGYYLFVTANGYVSSEMDDYSANNSRRYNLYKQGACNYFATRELAENSTIYKAFHPCDK